MAPASLTLPTLDALVSASVQHHGKRPALSFRGRDLTYGEFGTAVDRLARRLSDVVGQGDRLALLAPNSPALLIGLAASWRLGAIAVPLNARWRTLELEGTLRDARPRAIVSITHHAGYPFSDRLVELLPVVPTVRRCLFVRATGEVEDDLELGARQTDADRLDPGLGLVLYTSGTTGTPRGSMVLHRREVRGAKEMVDLLGLTASDVGVFVVPISHAFGLTCAMAMLTAGGRLVLIDSAVSTGPVAKAVGEHGATVVHGSPALFASLVKGTPACLDGVRTGFVAGAPSPPWLMKSLDRAGPRILNLYGMTEIGAASSVRAGDPPCVRHTTVGRPIAGYAFRIAGGGPEGEIEVRGPGLGPGYLGHPEPDEWIRADGWFRTGDVGSIDGDGNLSISGRVKDLVNVAGFSVSPAEVEACLTGHPDVLHVAVVGVPHPRTGEALQAFVVPRPGRTPGPGDLLRFARERIAAYKLPYRIVATTSLPLLPSGKPDRKRLAELARSGALP